MYRNDFVFVGKRVGLNVIRRREVSREANLRMPLNNR